VRGLLRYQINGRLFENMDISRMFSFILYEDYKFLQGYSFQGNGRRNTYEITERNCSMIRKVMIKRKTPKRRKFLNRTRRSPPCRFVAFTVIVFKTNRKIRLRHPKRIAVNIRLSLTLSSLN